MEYKGEKAEHFGKTSSMPRKMRESGHTRYLDSRSGQGTTWMYDIAIP